MRNHWRYLKLPCGRDMQFKFAEPTSAHEGYLEVTVFATQQGDSIPEKGVSSFSISSPLLGRKWSIKRKRHIIPRLPSPTRQRERPKQLTLL